MTRSDTCSSAPVAPHLRSMQQARSRPQAYGRRRGGCPCQPPPLVCRKQAVGRLRTGQAESSGRRSRRGLGRGSRDDLMTADAEDALMAQRQVEPPWEACPDNGWPAHRSRRTQGDGVNRLSSDRTDPLAGGHRNALLPRRADDILYFSVRGGTLAARRLPARFGQITPPRLSVSTPRPEGEGGTAENGRHESNGSQRHGTTAAVPLRLSASAGLWARGRAARRGEEDGQSPRGRGSRMARRERLPPRPDLRTTLLRCSASSSLALRAEGERPDGPPEGAPRRRIDTPAHARTR